MEDGLRERERERARERERERERESELSAHTQRPDALHSNKPVMAGE
jgi:hypothetical protein